MVDTVTADLCRARSARKALLVALPLLLFASCGGDEPQSESLEVQNQDVSGRSGLPIEAVLMLSDSEALALNQQLLVDLQACMDDRGFNVSLPPFPLSESVFSLQSRYGAIPTSSPETWGYRDPPLTSDQPTQVPPPLTDEQVAAMYGTEMVDESSTAGEPEPCFPSAMKKVYGNANGLAGLAGYNELVQLQLDSNDALYADGEAVEVIAQWSECMKAAGYSFSNWWEAPAAYLADQQSVENISNAERATATADQRCRESTDLESRLLKIESRIQEQLLESEQQILETFEASKRQLVAP